MARPKKPLLSRPLVTSAALKLIDAEGSDNISMRRIARELNVHPSSLYNHFSSRLELIEDIRGAITAKIDSRPLRELEWEAGILAWGKSYRAAFAEHPNAIPLLMFYGATSNVVLEMYEDFANAALRAGWGPEDIVPLLSALESFIIGSVLDMSGPNFLFDTVGREELYPSFSTALDEVQSAMSDGTLADRAFAMGLSGLLRGIERGHARDLGERDGDA